MFQKIADWFTPTRRRELQGLVTLIVPVLVAAGITTDFVAAQIGIIIAGVLQFGSSALSVAYLQSWKSSEAWTIVRGAFYTLGATLAPALLALGVLDDKTHTLIAGLGSVGLTVISSLIAIITNNKQYAE